MGPALHRLLARPSALRTLRQFTADSDQNVHLQNRILCTTHGLLGRQQNVTMVAVQQYEDERSDERKNRDDGKPGLHSVPPNVPAWGNVAEVCLRLSLGAGMSLLGDVVSEHNPYHALRYQSEVTGEPTMGPRLVDNAQNAQNMDLWLEILRFRERIDGYDGVAAVWKGMRDRNVDLPTEGPHAHALWSAFVRQIGYSPSGKFARVEIRHYAKDLKQRCGHYYNGFYALHMGPLLRRSHPDWILKLHDTLVEDGLVPENPIARIVTSAVHSGRPSITFRAFQRLYRASDERNLYDQAINELLHGEDLSAAVVWHNLFVECNDLPSVDMARKPGVRRLFELADRMQDIGISSAKKKAGKLQAEEKIQTPAFTRESMSTMIGEAHGIKPKEIKDDFCARLFATKAFSVDMVISGMSFFGVQTIGPLALREMALRAGTLADIAGALTRLKASEISISNAVYCRALLKFVSEDDMERLDGLLSSDQHPDAYQDALTLEALLSSHIDAGDWTLVHSTLAILTLSEVEPQTAGWNLLLQACCRLGDHLKTQQVYRDMRSSRIPIFSASIQAIVRRILRPRQRGKAPFRRHGPNDFDDLSFVTNVLINGMIDGSYVLSTRWLEIFKRYGMVGRFEELERLVVWLVPWYSGREVPQKHGVESLRNHPAYRRLNFSVMPPPEGVLKNDPAHPLRQLLPIITQEAIVHWGFTSKALNWMPPRQASLDALIAPKAPDSGYEEAFQCEPWARGVALLKRLKLSGVCIDTATVRKAVLQRLWMLYGPILTLYKPNLEARLRTWGDLRQRVRHIDELWGNMFDLPKAIYSKSEEEFRYVVFGPGSFRRTGAARKKEAQLGALKYRDPGPVWKDPYVRRYLRKRPLLGKKLARTIMCRRNN